MGRKNNQRKSAMSTVNKSGPAPNAVVYRGSIRGGAGANPDDTILVRMSYPNSAPGGATGLVHVANNTTVSGCTDWASYAATYGEYRVLGFEVNYQPHYPGGNAAVVHSAGQRFITHNSDTYVTPSIDIAIQHADWRPIHTGQMYRAQWKMSGEEEAGWTATATPTSVVQGSIFSVFSNASSNAQYGYFVVTFAVQFRDRK